MQDSGAPPKIPLPWGNAAGANYIRQIPTASQIGIINGAASFTDGFPPLSFLQPAAGGAGPWGADFNGILNQLSAGLQWLQAGAPLYYDSAFSAAIGGYPKGAIVASQTLGGLWQSLVDNNTADPDTGGANWGALFRPSLQSNTSVYVNAQTGSDSNAGTSALPWQTFSRAIKYINSIDTNGYSATINCSGNFATGLTVSAPIFGGGTVTFQFASNSSIAVTTGNAIAVTSNTFINVAGPVTLSSSGSASGGDGNACLCLNGGQVSFSAGPIFYTCNLGHMRVGNSSGIQINGAYTISGNANSHVISNSGIILLANSPTTAQAVTLQGSPAFASAFAVATQSGIITAQSANITYSGAAGGSRYTVDGTSRIDTYGGGANFFPGTTAGTATNTWNYT